MGNFNRNRSGGGDFRRGGFGGNRGSDRPVIMHQAVCSKCGKDCELPFRPTDDRPVFCSSCFENNRGTDSRRFESSNSERSNNFEDRPMFDAVCADCGNNCKVPFQPSSGKPVFCSNCFGDKKEGRSKGREQSNSQPQHDKQLEQLNTKLDRILAILAPNIVAETIEEKIIEEVKDQKVERQAVKAEKKTKVAKKKPSKKV